MIVNLTVRSQTVSLQVAALNTGPGGPGGASDHGALAGLADDDHPQYHNDARGDARYSQLGHTHSYEASGAAAAAIAAHEAAADPHPTYTTAAEAAAAAPVQSVAGRTGAVTLAVADVSGAESTANKAQPSGYASLDSSGKVPQAQLPSIAITEFLGEAANQSAMLALSGQKGDWCIRTDTGATWIITGTDPTLLGSWTAISYPTSAVTSVAGRTGAVTLSASDVTSGTLDAARLPAPGTTTLGGVKRNTGSAGQYVIGIDTDGSLLRDTPNGGGSPGGSSGQLQYNDGSGFSGAPLWREDANTVAQRNGSTAQVAYFYQDATDGSNYERLALLPGAAAGWMQVAAQTAGTGTDNIGIALTPAGTGAISAQVPDSTATGGNARGAGAIDWQTIRSAANMVASGARAVISGGSYNRASGDGSVVGGGSYGIASGYYSAIPGGVNCTASNYYSLAAMYGCTASGTAALALGYHTTASGTSSWALGQQSTTRGLTGAYAYSSGQRSALGDAQVIGQQVRRTTTDSTPVALATDGTPAAATVMVLPANSAMTVSALVVARDSAGNVAGWRAEALFKRDGSNNTTRLGSATVTAIGTPDAALSTATIDLVANNTLESVEIQVTGVAATTIYWVGELKCVQVA